MPDALWDIAKPLLPEFAARPQGGEASPVDEGAVFTAVVFVLTSGRAWRHLPPPFGVGVPTAHHRLWCGSMPGCSVWHRDTRPARSGR
ncbi:transposase [Nocardia gamkensis]|uniref:transposase n=1 Tax=Nocardia gamkensis TaxID=352869 RepID=UPI0036EEB25E